MFVFNGGYLEERDRWFCGNDRKEALNACKYLGWYFTTKLRFSFACNDFAARGKSAVLGILIVLYKFENQSMIIFEKLFASNVQPVLLYAAEIWGLQDDCCYQVEKTYLFALKRFLGVGHRTLNNMINMIHGDTARYPLNVNAYVRTIRYWLKITRMC